MSPLLGACSMVNPRTPGAGGVTRFFVSQLSRASLLNTSRPPSTVCPSHLPLPPCIYNHFPFSRIAPPTATASKLPKTRRPREPGIQLGKPLPEFGTCEHYKKSHRWLRFPCCGKAYPCDTCHDTREDHPMELANRMICGYCSKEQGYTGSKPCILCGSDLAHVKSSSHWEGGQGCRNKTRMSR